MLFARRGLIRALGVFELLYERSPFSNSMGCICWRRGRIGWSGLRVYFKRGVTHDQLNYIWENVLSRPNADGRGYLHRDGIGMLSRVYPPVEGHEGVAVNFPANATQAQREEIKREVNASPIVFKVLENVAPLHVKKL